MAIDNLNYYSSWLPAWQLTDKYSSQPWCLKSKNLDIFSSSKSVKATAWSSPIVVDNPWIVAQDEYGKIILKTDWKVYQRVGGVDTLLIDPSVNFPVYQVSYTWSDWPYENAQRWTPVDMVVKYEWNQRKTIIVYTDTASFTYLSEKLTYDKKIWDLNNISVKYSGDKTSDWYVFEKTSTSATTSSMRLYIPEGKFTNVKLKIRANQYYNSKTDIELTKITIRPTRYYYDAEVDAMVADKTLNSYDITTFSGSIRDEWWLTLDLPSFPPYSSWSWCVLEFWYTQHEWASNYSWSGELYIDYNEESDQENIWGWDSNYFYSYLPLGYRKKQEVWEYYWAKSPTFQVLYQRVSYWLTRNWQKVTVYDLEQYMWWANDPNMDVIWMIAWNEQIYMIWNMNWNGYIIPCDLTWGRWTPFIAYGCKFKWVTNIDYLLYLVWEDRGVSTLWVFNQQELVPILWWRQEVQYNDRIWVDEQYRFDWKILNRRKNLILTTTDNRIFQYGQTYGGKWWSFIHGLPSNAVITWLNANGNDLTINYSVTVNNTTTYYVIKYQDDAPIKNYNTEWQAVYPIVLWNHLLEKEESDLDASYILPASSCKLEFWGMANHYHFWTFTSEDNVTLSTTTNYKLKWSSGTYNLKFLERNWNQYTFRLEGDLPVQITNEMKIIDGDNMDVITYSDFNHFRKIWVIETDKYCEWEFRFHNLNNKLELPKSHSLQIMVKGKGTANYTPELFSVDLVANQRERW